jgi:hypothetical protein
MQRPSSTVARPGPLVILGTRENKKPNPNAMLCFLKMQIYAVSAAQGWLCDSMGTIRSAMRGGTNLSPLGIAFLSRRPIFRFPHLLPSALEAQNADRLSFVSVVAFLAMPIARGARSEGAVLLRCKKHDSSTGSPGITLNTDQAASS